MDKPSEEKPDDLEITSIGALYCGQWDKKYWSSSRGKDRCPYPVGYQAIRTHSGNTYRMEIREGPKGPVFAVTSPDGDSCTGQTPDIAWENFQKKSSPRVKNWLGKRFSSKIDGVELFGFRNPFVQRLLRELVANVNEVAERSLVVPTFCNRSSKLDHERIEKFHAYPDLLPFLGKQQITGKRSMKNRNSAENLIKEARIKRTRSKVLLNNAESNSSKQEGEICFFSYVKSAVCFPEEQMSSSKDGATIQFTPSHFSNSPGDGIAILNNEAPDPECQNDCKTAGCASSIKSCDRTVDPGSSLQVKAVDALEENCHPLLAAGLVPMQSKHSECFVEENILSQEQSSHIGHESPILASVGETPLEKFFDAELQQRDCLTSPKNSGGEHVHLVTCPDCVPDTCDIEKDAVLGSPLEGYKTGLCTKNNELDVARPVLKASAFCASRFALRSLPEEIDSKSNPDISKSMHPLLDEVHVMHPLPQQLNVTGTLVDTLPKGAIKDSLPEVGTSSSSSNPSSEKIDLDLAGQELARSMMTFLLPRAVPLLTKTYVKRRSRHRSRENKDPCSTSSAPNSAEQIGSKHLPTMMCQGENVAKVLVQKPEVNTEEKISASQELPGVDSLYPVTRVEPLLAGCITTEPSTESGSSKGVKSVIPDSFEDDQCADDVATNREFPPNFDEVDIAFFDGINGKLNSPLLPENNSEKPCFCSGNDGCHREILLPDGNEKDNAQAEIPSQKFMPRQGLSTCEKAELDQGPPCPDNELGDEIPKDDIFQSHLLCSPEKNHSYSPNGQVNFDVHAATDSEDVNVKNQVGPSHITPVRHYKRADSMMKGESSLLCKPNVFSSGELPFGESSSKKYIVPLSEIIICRNYKNSNSPELHFPQMMPERDDHDQAKYTGSDADIRISFTNEVKVDEELHQLITVENVSASVHAPSIAAADASWNQDVAKNVNDDIKPSSFIDPTVSRFMDCVHAVIDLSLPGEGCTQSKEQTNALGSLPSSDIDPSIQATTDHDGKGHSHTQVPQKCHLDDSFSKRENSTLDTRDSMELVGCYLHPNPVLSISVASKEDGLQICVLCGLVDSDIRNLFMYMIPVQGYRENGPSFLGYTSLMLPHLKDPRYRNIPFEKYGVQFIPDRQSLVLLNSIKAPRCREQNFDCSCTNCTSDCSEENTVEIVHIYFGYVSSVIKLVTAERVSSILVCEPNYLIAVEQSGKLNVWVMNMEWSVNLEKFLLPNCDEISPVILELKRIPNCKSVIIGHNGYGGFALWDISQRVVLANFSSPGLMTFQILPVGLFKCQNKDSLTTCMEMDHIRETSPMTDNWHPKAGEDPSLSSLEDIAVWLLVSADSSVNVQSRIEEPNTIPVGCWRLGLLVRNVVVLGSILDPRASAASTSSHYGIYGTCDGFLYKWKLSSGEKLASLHPFRCGSVSDIAIDAKSGGLAVAGNGCQLQVYVQPQVKL